MHGQHDADLGPGDLRQSGDLALGVHAHLEDRDLVLRREVQQRHRQTGLAVQVALVAQDAQGARQDIGRDLLRNRLAGRAGDPDDADARSGTPPGSQLLQCGQRVRDLHDRHAPSGGNLYRTLDQQDSRPGSNGLGHESMAVVALASQRDEAATRDDVARIDRGGGEGGDARRPEESAAGGGQEVVEPYRGWHAAPGRGFGRV